MTLSFKTQITGKPTYFVEKIWKSFYKGVTMNLNEFVEYSKLLTKDQKYKIDAVPAKIHTIREDKKDRWKSGNEIHFVINNRIPNRFQFAPVIPCLNTQLIEILPDKEYVKIWKMCEPSYQLSDLGIKLLASNDGFDSIEDFWKFFNKDFEGKIIHWTDFKY